jgi:ribosomal subunit interface protein
MQKRITFRGMEHSPVIEQHADEQMSKIVTFLEHEPTPVFIDLVLEAHRHHAHHKVELRIKSPNYEVISNYEGPDLYKVLDRVLDVAYETLHEKKRQRVDKNKTREKY